MDTPIHDPAAEIDFIKSVVKRTNQRIDGQAFHTVHWGLIVLIWYPLANYFTDQGMNAAVIGLGVGSIILGMVLSAVRSVRAGGRLPGENTFISRQLFKVFLGCIGGGMVLSGVCPTSQLIDGQNVPILWGLVYANLAFMIGVVYNRDFVVAGVLIFLGTVAAMYLKEYQGYILGPVMGLGMLIPGLRAESRLAALLRETNNPTGEGVA